MTAVIAYFNDRLIFFEEDGQIQYDVELDIAIEGWQDRYKARTADPVKLYTKEEYIAAEAIMLKQSCPYKLEETEHGSAA